MQRYQKSKYAVYFNTHEPHVTIHTLSIHPNPEKHGGDHKHKQGGWGYFVTYFEAYEFANGISLTKDLPLKQCIRCSKEKV